MTDAEFKAREVIKNILRRHCDGKMPVQAPLIGVDTRASTITAGSLVYPATISPDELVKLRSFLNS